jgi:asparagine synthase (glutamine-hydrolysing)
MPFLDRRLVEWALALPEDQRRRGGATKVVLRHAAEGVLPRLIVHRERGPDFSFLTARGLREIGGWRLLESVLATRSEWVDKGAVEKLWREMTAETAAAGGNPAHASWVLWLLVGTHFAAQAIERCRAAPSITSTIPAVNTMGGAHADVPLEIVA